MKKIAVILFVSGPEKQPLFVKNYFLFLKSFKKDFQKNKGLKKLSFLLERSLLLSTKEPYYRTFFFSAPFQKDVLQKIEGFAPEEIVIVSDRLVSDFQNVFFHGRFFLSEYFVHFSCDVFKTSSISKKAVQEAMNTLIQQIRDVRTAALTKEH